MYAGWNVSGRSSSLGMPAHFAQPDSADHLALALGHFVPDDLTVAKQVWAWGGLSGRGREGDWVAGLPSPLRGEEGLGGCFQRVALRFTRCYSRRPRWGRGTGIQNPAIASRASRRGVGTECRNPTIRGLIVGVTWGLRKGAFLVGGIEKGSFLCLWVSRGVEASAARFRVPCEGPKDRERPEMMKLVAIMLHDIQL
jgi:hypothetical protein